MSADEHFSNILNSSLQEVINSTFDEVCLLFQIEALASTSKYKNSNIINCVVLAHLYQRLSS